MKSASRSLLSVLALHIAAWSLGTSNLKPPLADECPHRIKLQTSHRTSKYSIF